IPHPYYPRGPGDLRSPCPALNSLANHGILPRNGANIPRESFVDAVHNVFNFTLSFANVLLDAAQSCCSSPTQTGIDLSALARHDGIEHDASLVHADANGAAFAPTTVDPALLADVLSRSPKGLTLRDIAQIRVDREAYLAVPLPFAGRQGGLLEASLFHRILKNAAGVVPNERARIWLGKERFPEGFITPVEE
ncbi:heme-thiolate peroxidase, partial [Mycena rebaudengoi]